MDPNPKYKGRDPLAEIIEVAKPLGLDVIPWFEYGLKILYAGADKENPNIPSTKHHPVADVIEKKGWLSLNQEGKPWLANSGFFMAFLNPAMRETKDFLVGIVGEVASREGVNGIMFDDHLSLHNTFGYDEASKKQFAASGETDFVKWRADRVTYVTRSIAKEVHKYSADGVQKPLILSPGGGQSFSYNIWLQNWEAMAKERVVDEIIVQVYRYDVEKFINTLKDPSIANAAKTVPIGVGLLSGLANNRGETGFMSGTLIREQTNEVLKRGWGVSYFFNGSLLKPVVNSKLQETQEERNCHIDKLFSTMTNYSDCSK